ncbi:MAG: tetratricopeptide repeat protein [Bacillota bacterium]|nr:tetratricopeptide repeat protein [Bacillota bacterium]
MAEVLVANTGLMGVETAESTFHTVLEIDPGNIEALNLLAQICAQTRRHKEAREFLACAVESAGSEKDPEVAVELVKNLAEIYEGAHRFQLAAGIYELGLERIDSAVFHHGIAYCYAKLGHYRKALSHSRRAVEMDPNNSVFVSDLGYTLLETGDLHGAKSLFERAIELDPANKLARGNLAHCVELMEQGRADQDERSGRS